jgi:hypothetical protein
MDHFKRWRPFGNPVPVHPRNYLAQDRILPAQSFFNPAVFQQIEQIRRQIRFRKTA